MTTRVAESATLRDDRIDLLIPPPRPWWVRLAVALVIVGVVGGLGWLWNGGALRPVPDCCGSGSAQPTMSLSEESGAVVVTAYFFNSSSRAVSIVGAGADLPGARVVDVAPFESPEFGQTLPPLGVSNFPYRVEGHGHVWFAISFVAERCDDNSGHWGSVQLDLEVADNPWYPTFDRTFTLPDPVVAQGPGQLGFMTSSKLAGNVESSLGPLAAGCALLGE